MARDVEFRIVINASTGRAELRQIKGDFDRLGKSGRTAGNDLNRGMRTGANATDRARRAAQRASREFRSMGNSAQRATEQIAAIRTAIAGFIAATAAIGTSVKAAIDFESAMADVRKVVDFETPGGFTALREELLALSDEIPVSVNGLAEIAAAGGQLGIAEKDLSRFVETVSKMSTAFDLLPQEAGQSIGELINIFDLSIDQAGLLGDQINTLGNNTAASERKILDFLTRVGGVARNFGLTATQVSALGTAMISLGTPAEVSARAVNNMLQTLQGLNVASPTTVAGFERLGINIDKFVQLVKTEPVAAIDVFLNKLKELDSTTRTEALTQIFGQGFSDEIAKLVQGLGTYQQALRLVADEGRNAGAMQQEFAIRSQTTANQLQLMRNGIHQIGINLGSVFLPAFNRVISVIRDASQAISSFIQRFPALSAGVTALTSLAAGATAARAAFVGLRAAGIGLTAFLAAVGGPIGIAVGALAALALAIYDARNATVSLGNEQTTVGDLFAVTWEAIRGHVQTSVDFILTQVGEMLPGIQETLQGVIESFVNVFGKIPELALTAVNTMIGIFVSLGEAIGSVAAGMVQTFSNAFSNIVSLAVAAGQDIRAAFSGEFGTSNISAAFGNLQSEFGQDLAQIGQTIGEDFSENVGRNWVGDFFQGASDQFRNVFDFGQDALNNLFSRAAQRTRQSNTEVQSLNRSINDINDTLSSSNKKWDVFGTNVKEQSEEAAKGVGGVGEALGELDEDMRNSERLFETVADTLSSGFRDAFEGIVDGSKSVGEALKDLVNTFVQAINDIAIDTLTQKITQAFDFSGGDFPLLNNLTSGGGFLSDLFGGGKNLLSSLFGFLFHSGGIVGGTGAGRRLPALAFAGAPRYHSGGIAGLAADEVPAILRRGEEVLTESDPRHRRNGGGGVSVYMTVYAQDANSFRRSESQIGLSAARAANRALSRNG